VLGCSWEFLSSKLQFVQDVNIFAVITSLGMHAAVQRKLSEWESHLHESQIPPQDQWDVILSKSQKCPT